LLPPEMDWYRWHGAQKHKGNQLWWSMSNVDTFMESVVLI